MDKHVHLEQPTRRVSRCRGTAVHQMSYKKEHVRHSFVLRRVHAARMQTILAIGYGGLRACLSVIVGI
jgi:hypothetical protein